MSDAKYKIKDEMGMVSMPTPSHRRNIFFLFGIIQFSDDPVFKGPPPHTNKCRWSFFLETQTICMTIH